MHALAVGLEGQATKMGKGRITMSTLQCGKYKISILCTDSRYRIDDDCELHVEG